MTLAFALLIFVIPVTSFAVEADAFERGLVGEWQFTSVTNQDNFGRGLTINEDLSFMHDKVGEGDIRREAGDRYRVRVYNGADCEILVRRLSSDQLVIAPLGGARSCQNLFVGNARRKVTAITPAREEFRAGDGSTPRQDILEIGDGSTTPLNFGAAR